MQKTIENIKVEWENAFPEYIFKYTFMDQQIKDLYKGEQRITAFLKITYFYYDCDRLSRLVRLGYVHGQSYEKGNWREKSAWRLECQHHFTLHQRIC